MLQDTLIGKLVEHKFLFWLFLLLIYYLMRCLVFGLAALRAGVPLKDFIKSSELQKKVCREQGLLLYKRDINGRKRVSLEVYAKTALTLLVPGIIWVLLSRLFFGSDMSFWHGFILAEIFTTISASYGWREFGTIHVPLLSIPAALLGGLIAAL